MSTINAFLNQFTTDSDAKGRTKRLGKTKVRIKGSDGVTRTFSIPGQLDSLELSDIVDYVISLPEHDGMTMKSDRHPITGDGVVQADAQRTLPSVHGEKAALIFQAVAMEDFPEFVAPELTGSVVPPPLPSPEDASDPTGASELTGSVVPPPLPSPEDASDPTGASEHNRLSHVNGNGQVPQTAK